MKKIFFLHCFLIVPVVYSMDGNNFHRFGGFSIPPKIYKPTCYFVKALIYGEKTDTTLAVAATLASFVAYPLHIITGKTALTLQALLFAKHIITFRLFLNKPDSVFLRKDTATNNLCQQYSIFLLGAGLAYAAVIKSMHIVNQFSSKK